MAPLPIIRGGTRVERIKDQNPPCRWCPKIPREIVNPTPADAVELNGRNWLAYRHYLECKATGDFPRDAIVRRNAALIMRVEEVAAEVRSSGAGARAMLLAMMQKGK